MPRTTLQTLLNEKKVEDETEWCVRIHPVQYQEDFIKDINTIFCAKCLPSAISIPHFNNCKQIEWFFQKIREKISARNVIGKRKINLLLEISSPKGIMRLQEICEKVKDLTESKSSESLTIQFSALIFAYDTLKQHIGTNKTQGGLECLYLRQKLVLIAKAFGLQAIDYPHRNLKDDKELVNECEDGVTLGFTGKLVYHPSQIGVVQSIFSPTRSRVKESRVIAERYVTLDEGARSGIVDAEPELSMDPEELQVAQNVLEVHEMASKYKTDKGQDTV